MSSQQAMLMLSSTRSNLLTPTLLMRNGWMRDGWMRNSAIAQDLVSGCLVSGCLVSAVFLLLASPAAAQTRGEEATETMILASEIESTATPTIEQTTEWLDATPLKDSFLQGCLGEEPTALLERRTKRSFCQCALGAYSGRFSPYQFMQVNALASQIGEDGILLVNLMMTNEMKACSEETGFDLEQ